MEREEDRYLAKMHAYVKLKKPRESFSRSIKKGKRKRTREKSRTTKKEKKRGEKKSEEKRKRKETYIYIYRLSKKILAKWITWNRRHDVDFRWTKRVGIDERSMKRSIRGQLFNYPVFLGDRKINMDERWIESRDRELATMVRDWCENGRKKEEEKLSSYLCACEHCGILFIHGIVERISRFANVITNNTM